MSLAETVHAVELFRGDRVIVTGALTGDAPAVVDLLEAKAAGKLPVVLGSGITPQNLADYWSAADGFIVGSYFKQDGLWSNPVDPERVGIMMTHAENLRVQIGD